MLGLVVTCATQRKPTPIVVMGEAMALVVEVTAANTVVVGRRQEMIQGAQGGD